MNGRSPAGPDPSAPWRTLPVTLPDGGVVAVRVAPDAAAGDRLFHCLADQAAPALDENGLPRVSLTLLLSRVPSPAEPTIYPLIERSVFTLGVALAVDSGALGALAADLGAECRPLFARSARFSLRTGDGETVAEASGAGTNPAAVLSGTLERDESLGVLRALDGAAAGLWVEAEVAFRTGPARASVHLTGSWSQVWEALSARAGAGATLDRPALVDALLDLVETGVIVSSNGTGDDDPALTEALMRSAAAAAVVDRQTPELAPRDPRNVYRLRRRPSGAARLDVSETVVAAGSAELTITTPLADLLGGALDGLDRGRFVHLLGPDEDGGGLRSVPPLVRIARRLTAREAGPGDEGLHMVETGPHLRSLALVLAGGAAPSAHALIHSDVVRPVAAGALTAWVADDAVVAGDGDALESLPVVESPEAAYFRDRRDPTRVWYLPRFSVVEPAPDDDPQTSAFGFVLSPPTVVAGDSDATAGLQAHVVFTLDRGMPEATAAALPAGVSASAVPTGNLSVSLEIPFREAGSAETRTQTLLAEVEENGRLEIGVDLLDSWARLCYAALAYEHLSPQPARLRVAYAYRAYAPIRPGGLTLAFGGKVSRVELERLRGAGDSDVAFDPETATLRADGMLLDLGVGRTRGARPLPGLAMATPVHAVGPAAVHAATTPSVVPAHAAVAVHPELTVAHAAAALVGRVRYVTRTFVQEETVEVAFPCADFGGFYRQLTADGEQAIGCRDVLRLGEIEYRLYDELPALRQPLYRVFRSLQQPGRFLVLPETYRIGRYGPSEPAQRAYRPIVVLYGIMDTPPKPSRYFLAASLQPDIPYHARRALRDALRSLTPRGVEPVLDYPTEPGIESLVDCTFALPNGIDQPEVRQVWDGFQVNVSTELANALALTTLIETSGLRGTARFTLADGQKLTSALVLDTTVVGPWDSDPVEVRLDGTSAHLLNRAEQKANVFELVIGGGERSGDRIAAETSLAPGASDDVDVGAGAEDLYPVYDLVAAKLQLQQLNVFVEDVAVNVLFVNQVDFTKHGLSAIEVGARLHGAEQEYALTLADGQNGAIELTLPLPTYLERQLLEFRLTKRLTSGTAEVGEWESWDLKTRGTVVSITPELVA